MSVAAQADTETVTGIVQGIVQKAADKWQIEVNTGQQNPRRLWTKDAELVQQMMGLIGQQLSFMCGKSHWTNASGQPVTSLWINGYGQPGSIAPSPQPAMPLPVQQFPQQQPAPLTGQWDPRTQQQMQQPAPLPQPQQQGPSAYERDERIMREAAAGVAVQLLKHLHVDDQNFSNLIKMSERLVAYYKNGVPPGWTGDNPGDGDGAPAHTDDDIPF